LGRPSRGKHFSTGGGYNSKVSERRERTGQEKNDDKKNVGGGVYLESYEAKDQGTLLAGANFVTYHKENYFDEEKGGTK